MNKKLLIIPTILLFLISSVMATADTNPGFNLVFSGIPNNINNNFCNRADIDRNGIVNIDDYWIIDSQYRLQKGCNSFNSWCNNADINKDGKINKIDYFIIDSEFITNRKCVQNPVANKGWGNVLLWYGDQLQLIAGGIKSGDYTLIYYDDKNTEELPYVECVLNKTITSYGSKIITFNYLPFLDNEKNERFVLVPSNSVNCNSHQMLNWMPSNYLFASNTI